MLIIPPVLVACLECFDGTRTDLDLRAALVSLTGDLSVGEIADNLTNTLSTAGFLEDEAFVRMRQDRMGEFAQSPVRAPAHAGAAYPASPQEVRQTLIRYLGLAGQPAGAATLFA